MRIVSLQPSVSVILDCLGQIDTLVACTRYCLDVVPELRRRNLPLVHDAWTTTTDELTVLRPDLVIASVPYRHESLAAILKASFPVLALAPHSIADIYSDIRLIGSIVHAPERAAAVINSMQAAIAETSSRTLAASKRPRVYCEEWGKPLIHSQHWVKELVEAAGGEFVGLPGAVTKAEIIIATDPDVVVMAWCGAGMRVPLERTVEKRGWQQLRAVSERRVFCITEELLNTPAPTLIGGMRALASVIHPEIFGPMQSPQLRCIDFESEPSKLV
ncbi:ABC transporter substrate-binding protein [Alloacidobacterium sp.]|uniref:ABC transporter substrate-binding protein n=1 Tax=Alloacidobacterium sp. TaxID=2951999 RepID=UPI002D2A8974|nr:ABC transporter substrate-binding protein [Alloacidobacterium sp.]HYK36005.1 ABC transporter substrate-binding protein [Alloacidobacterium sp.]